MDLTREDARLVLIILGLSIYVRKIEENGVCYLLTGDGAIDVGIRLVKFSLVIYRFTGYVRDRERS